MIAILLVSILIILSGRLFKSFESSSVTQNMPTIVSDSSYQGYPAILAEPSLFSTVSPVYGTVGRKIRPPSRPASGVGLPMCRKIYTPEELQYSKRGSYYDVII